ncbi:MAG: UDP-N-acetylglucosamine 1-carboxyvinyltransferase [Chloroflexota bacterium]|jgi:UDP-N-acetylglucosamine 1-carboxyvinyltransferase
MVLERFIIEGGARLQGSITPSGNKNAALPILAASLLTDQPLTVRNVPRIRDVEDMLALLASLGVEITELTPYDLVLRARDVRTTKLNRDLCERIRASILLAGPMLARAGELMLPPPGGDVIGRRRVDTHLAALKALGAEIAILDGFKMQARGLRGTEIFLDEASVTGTENALMAAAMAEGTTVLRNAASEPHVQDLARCLNKMGARISGIGSNTLTIEGVDRLGSAEVEIGPDHIEVGSYIGLAAMTRSELRINNAAPEHLPMVFIAFERMGIRCQILGATADGKSTAVQATGSMSYLRSTHGCDVLVPAEQSLKIESDIHNAVPKIDDGPWPAFPSDLMSIALTVATQCEGTILMHEKMFEGRMFFVDKLINMGARIVLCDPHRAVVVGPSKLHGERLESPDIRAGMALLLAALTAKGRSVINNIGQIDRGYERIEEKLQKLGAQIERVKV